MPEQMLNILLVEDDELDVINVQRAFKKSNILNPLYVAGNGIEALEILRGTAAGVPRYPNERRLIILDLNMPKMNGIEFLSALRQDPALRSVPVVVLTTSGEERDRMNAYDFNVAGYILKPVTISSFIETLTTLNKYWMLCELP